MGAEKHALCTKGGTEGLFCTDETKFCASGTPVTFDFTILDEGNRIAYTRSVGPKTVNGNLSVDLGDISDRSKWKATPYEDLGIDNADGKRMYWAQRKLGATADFGVNSFGLFYAWGATTGYPVRDSGGGKYTSEHDFYKDPAFELDENNRLKPAYDAAYVNLGGAWRIPTSDEWRRLWDNTKHGFTEQSSVHYARVLLSKVSGFTDKYIYLPQPGYVHWQKLTGIVDGVCDGRIYYWTSDYADYYAGDHRAFLFMVIGTVNPDWTPFDIGFGPPIRPVFTLQ